jgi:hypothetical protein
MDLFRLFCSLTVDPFLVLAQAVHNSANAIHNSTNPMTTAQDANNTASISPGPFAALVRSSGTC